ncbi:sulfotransferase [Cognatiluteimonas weifangensis]|uniref:sulfotransferase n=1 Tax=Cognatiluteimonas weifangensis TaxID=2303539 RepID=UPI0013143F86|nr:sulfotransferase [Luteimonas weifangensis]
MNPSARRILQHSGLPELVKAVSNRHRPGTRPNVFLMATPRSGSTWLMELIWSQPGFKCCDEPLNLRRPAVRRASRIASWREMESAAGAAKIERYFRAICDGRLHSVDALPSRGKYHRFRTDRIVFKLLHGAESRLGALAADCNARVVVLLRHPIAVSLSRKEFPRLDAFRNSVVSTRFDAGQLALADRVLADGSELEKGVLAWCFQNALVLQGRQPDWTVVSYEQLVLDPEPLVAQLVERLQLPDPARIFAHLTEAAGNKGMSDPNTQQLLAEQAAGRLAHKQALVEKWRARVTPEQETAAMALLDAFGLDAYRAGRLLPTPRYWIGGAPPALA